MTLTEVVEMISEIDIDFAYDHFAEGESPDPPFLVYLYPESNNFSADGIVYQKISVLHIELYTDEKDPTSELVVENVLDAHEIFYEKSEVWIADEKLYEVLYSMEVLINVE